ncbi:MAG: hypothetical protein E7Z78_05275 [Methanobrevibacter thaueri]|jgi:hypothetical protein|uniref:hypothetical protein n=1 Tax=Methanobrevibacter thaueri TaxID=190975 RepID=UPI0026EF8AFA|nr:hypothetical protein [Methanobrevibacter thaueri]MBE6495838.1 hypothetical protein [Methanobrevibacter thaueri]
MRDELLERLSELEHEQWCEWSSHLSQELSSLLVILDKLDDELSDEDKQTIFNIKSKLNRWNELQIPYSELSEEEKEKDRVYARKIISILDDEI